MEDVFKDKHGGFYTKESKDSSIAGGSVWAERETMLKNKSVLASANNRIMVGLRTFLSTLVCTTVNQTCCIFG